MCEKASPDRIPSHFFFTNLTNDKYNAYKYEELVNSDKTKTIIEGYNFKLVSIITKRGITYYGIDTQTKRVYYYLLFVEKNFPKLDKTAIDREAWVDKKSLRSDVISAMVVFRVLLKEYDTVMSEGTQTPAGEKLWENLISRHQFSGMTLYIGLYNIKTKNLITPLTNESNTSFWERVSSIAYGADDKFSDLRFVISKNKLA